MTALTDPAAFWDLHRRDRGALYLATGARYPAMPLVYVMTYVDHLAEIDGNPRVLTYLDAELGAVARAEALLDGLKDAVTVRGARVLDIGCSNGALLLAAQARGARVCVGVDAAESRLPAARRMTSGYPVELVHHEAGSGPLPGGPYDLITCLDTLEHVADWRAVLRYALAALAPAGRFFLSLHNAEHPDTVLVEPHYGLPGMVRLQTADAAALWGRVRGQLGSTLDYDVVAWPTYPMLTAALDGLTVQPWTDCRPAYDPESWVTLGPPIVGLEGRACAALQRLGVDVWGPDATTLLGATCQYVDDAVASWRHAVAEPMDRLAWYIAHQAQPLNLLVTADG